MKFRPELNYWLDIKTEDEAREKILTDCDWEKRTQEDLGRIDKAIGLGENDTILDFGCGIGRLLKPVSDICEKAVGADVSDAMLQHAYRHLIPRGNVFLIRMFSESSINSPDEYFDKIYSLLVLQHMEKSDAIAVLKEFRRILKPKGKGFFQFPDVENREFYTTYMKNKHEMGGMINLMEFYSEPEIRIIMDHVGLKLVSVDSDGKDFYVTVVK